MKNSIHTFQPSALGQAVQTLMQGTVITLGLMGSALAQTAVAPVSSDMDAKSPETLIVTGRAGTGIRTKINTSYSITTIDEESLRMQAPTSASQMVQESDLL